MCVNLSFHLSEDPIYSSMHCCCALLSIHYHTNARILNVTTIIEFVQKNSIDLSVAVVNVSLMNLLKSEDFPTPNSPHKITFCSGILTLAIFVGWFLAYVPVPCLIFSLLLCFATFPHQSAHRPTAFC